MRKSSKKVLSGATAIVCVIIVLLSGTYAWQAITNAVNPFSGEREEAELGEAGANLHDNFDTSTGAKEVYVENTGDNPVLVRIKLQEVLDTTTHEKPASITWTTHIPDATVEDCDGGFHDAFDNAFEWTMGNDTERNYRSIVGTAAWNAAADREELDELVADAFGDAQAPKKANTSTGTTKQAPACEVISMADYKIRTDKDTFLGWVYDTDGYAYWSQILQPEATTGLLLDGVSLPEYGLYYYAINVVMEYIDGVDLPSWLDGSVTIKEGSNTGQMTDEASSDAKDMLNDITTTNWSMYNTVGDTFWASGWEWVVIAVDGNHALVTTTKVVGTTRFHATSNVYIGSELDVKTRRFYNILFEYDQLSSIDAKITEVAMPSDFATAIPPYADRLNPAGLSKVDTSGIRTCFALSHKEYTEYLFGNPELVSAGRPREHKIVADMGNAFIGSGDQSYWLRTGSPSSNTAEIVMSTGTIASGNTGNSFAVRPALWINIQ